MTVTGAVVIALVLGPTAWLVLRGDRAARQPRTVENLFPPGSAPLTTVRTGQPLPIVPGRCRGPDTTPHPQGSRRSTR